MVTVNPTFIWQLEDYLRFATHQSSLVRKWAQTRLIDLYPSQAKKAMLKFLNDPDKMIASLAAIFLGDWGDEGCGIALLSCFKKSQGMLASNCAVALGKIGYKEAIPFLINRLKQREEEVLRGIIHSLGLIKEQQAKEVLLDCFQGKIPLSQNPDYHAFLCNSLLKQKDISLIPILVEDYLAQPEQSVMKSFMHHSRVDNLFDWLTDYSHDNLSNVLKEAEKCFSISLKDIPGYSLNWFFKGKILPAHLAKELTQKAQTFLSENGYPCSEWVRQRDNGTILPRFEEGILVPLTFLSAFSSPPVKHSDQELVFETAIFLVACYLRIRLDCETEKVIKDGQEQEFLFKIIGRDEKYQAERIVDRIVERNGKDALKILQRIIEENPDSWSAIAAAIAIGKLVKENLSDGIEAIPILLEGLKEDKGDFLCEACSGTLKIIGEPVLKEAEKLLKTGDNSQKIYLMGVFENIPTSESIDILLDNAEELWTEFDSCFLDALWNLGSKKAIPFLEKEWREGEVNLEEVLLLHYEINGLNPPHIKGIRNAYENREKKLDRKIEDIVDDPLNLKLRCLKCSKVYTYEVEEVFYDLNTLEDKKGSGNGYFIKKRIICKNCQAVNQYEFTSEAMLALMAEGMRMMMLAKEAKDKGEEYELEDFSRVRPVYFTADGGKKMNPYQAISLYQERIDREPDNPLWRLRYGNVMRFMEREDEAMVQYQKAIDLDDTCLEAYFNLGECYEEKEELSRARQIYQKILTVANVTTLSEDEEEIVEEVKERLDKYGHRSREMMRIQPPPASSPKIGRNQPCPCGSGKKYKHCCLEKS